MKNESNNIKTLNDIYQTAKMGVQGIMEIEGKVEDESLKKELQKEQEDYQSICDEAIEIFIKYGKKEKDISLMAEMSSKMMSEMKTMIDDSSSNIAKMMMEGTNKGIISMMEKINQTDIDEEIIELAKKLLKMEQKNIEKLKVYL